MFEFVIMLIVLTPLSVLSVLSVLHTDKSDKSDNNVNFILTITGFIFQYPLLQVAKIGSIYPADVMCFAYTPDVCLCPDIEDKQ